MLRAPSKHSLIGGPFGSNLVSADYTNEGIPVIRGGNLPMHTRFSYDDLVYVSEKKADKLTQNSAFPGDLVFTQRGTLGQVGLIPTDSPYPRFIISQSQMKMTVDPAKADPLFLFYYFRLPSTVELIEALAITSGIPHINLDILRKFPVPTPPLDTQRKIAAVLAAYDDLIEANRRRIALLERMAEELYREWFVRLRFPGHATTKITKGLPAGWRAGRFRELCRLKRGYDLPDGSIVPGPHPVVASTSIKAYHAEFKVEPPVITTGRSGSLGEVLLINQRAWPLNTSLYVQDFFGNSHYFVFYTLRGMHLENFNSGAGVPTLNRNHLEGLPMPIPSRDLQTQFDGLVGPMHQQAETLRSSNAALQRTRDLLLPRLISGKLPVEDLPIAFPPSMAESQEAKPA